MVRHSFICSQWNCYLGGSCPLESFRFSWAVTHMVPALETEARTWRISSVEEDDLVKSQSRIVHSIWMCQYPGIPKCFFFMGKWWLTHGWNGHEWARQMFKKDNFISCGYDKEYCQKIIVRNYQAILYEYISNADIYHPARFGVCPWEDVRNHNGV